MDEKQERQNAIIEALRPYLSNPAFYYQNHRDAVLNSLPPYQADFIRQLETAPIEEVRKKVIVKNEPAKLTLTLTFEEVAALDNAITFCSNNLAFRQDRAAACYVPQEEYYLDVLHHLSGVMENYLKQENRP